MIIKCLLAPLLLCISIASFEQTAQQKQLHFNFIGVKDGLPEGTVNALLQDKYGYVWVGTQNGLVRYDGYTPKIYYPGATLIDYTDISCIYEDNKGRLWVGTYKTELFLYNREKDTFIKVTPANFHNNSYIISSIWADDSANVWLTARTANKDAGCIMYYSAATKQLTTYGIHEAGKQYINADYFSGMVQDGQANMYIGSNNGIYKWNAASQSFTGYFISPKKTGWQTFIPQFADSVSHEIWMTGGDETLWKWNTSAKKPEQYTNKTTGGQLASDSVISIVKYGQLIWFATGNGIASYNPHQHTFSSFVPADKRINSLDNLIYEIQPDNKGGLWCMSELGLLYFNTVTGNFTRYITGGKNAVGLQGSSYRHLMVDKFGIPWFGTDQLGLQWVDKNSSKFSLYTSNASDHHHFAGGGVNSFAEAADSTYWIGSNNGLYNWQPANDVFTPVALGKGNAGDLYVNSVIVDKDGWVWCRAYGNAGTVLGLYAYNPLTKQIKNYRHLDGDTNTIGTNVIRAIYQDHEGLIWIGTFGEGVYSFDKHTQKFTHYPYTINTGVNSINKINGALDDDQVQTIYEDTAGTLWVGTNNGNLNRFNRQTKKFTSYGNNITDFGCVISLYQSSRGILWAGTYLSGLFGFNATTGKFNKLITTAKGLLYNGAWGVNEDNYGNIWVSSLRGITILNPATGNIRYITEANGLPAEPESFGLFKTGKGIMIAGTGDGFVMMNPNDFIPETQVPDVYIESVFVDEAASNNDSTLYAFGRKKIELKHNQNRLIFKYVGLLYQGVNSIQYACKLDGYDDDWINAGTDKDITYTNLSPGTYTFHVKAANSDGVWATKEAAITIVISPPWWQTWWAYLLSAIAIIAAIFIFIHFRSKRLKKENKKLEENVAQRTKELNTSLQELKATQAQLIQSEKMASLGELTAGIAHEIQNPLNFITNFSEVNAELITELKEELAKGNYDEVKFIAGDIEANEEKIVTHGKRADGIVKNMLQHSKKSSSVKEPVNINALIDEYLRLGYHGLRAKDNTFTTAITTSFDDNINTITIVPQDIGRVLLNIFNNAFYAVNKKNKEFNTAQPYQPAIYVSTKKINEKGIEIIIKDNGTGMPAQTAGKIFQPFFTTKPAGEGTGLGLSLSYDIITRQHQGTIEVNSIDGEGTTFTIFIPA